MDRIGRRRGARELGRTAEVRLRTRGYVLHLSSYLPSHEHTLLVITHAGAYSHTPTHLTRSILGRQHAYWAGPFSCLCRSSWTLLLGRQQSQGRHSWWHEADEARKWSFTSFSFTSAQYCYSVRSCKRRSCAKRVLTVIMFFQLPAEHWPAGKSTATMNKKEFQFHVS